jgi:hypothetical protein
VLKVSAEDKKLIVVVDSTIDNGRPKLQVQLMAHNPPDAGIRDEGEVAITQTHPIVEVDNMSKYFGVHDERFINYRLTSFIPYFRPIQLATFALTR